MIEVGDRDRAAVQLAELDEELHGAEAAVDDAELAVIAANAELAAATESSPD